MNLLKSIFGSTALHITVLGVILLADVPTDLESDTEVDTQLENQVDVKRLNLAKLLGRAGEKSTGGSDDKATSNAGEDKAPRTNQKSEKTASKTQRDRQNESTESTESEKDSPPEQEPSEEINRTKKIAAKSELESSDKEEVETGESSEASEEGEPGESKTAASKGPADGGDGAGGDGTGGSGSGEQGLSDDVRAGLIRGYSESIYRVVNRQKTYPRLAKRMGQEGTVTVEIMVDSTGRILKVRVANSSGSEILDEAARDLFQSLDQLPAPPKKLAWTKKKLQIPLRYSLS
jgi:protein TonB